MRAGAGWPMIARRRAGTARGAWGSWRRGEGLGHRRKAARHAWLLATLVVLGGCTAPLTVEQLGPQAAYRRLDRSALSENLPSEATRITLRRRGLLESLDYWPDETIAA